MELIDRVKLYLGISHNGKDAEIEANFTTARAELVRSGVSSELADSTDPLVEDAVLQFTMYRMAPTRNDDYQSAWLYQQDCLRRSKGYSGDRE